MNHEELVDYLAKLDKSVQLAYRDLEIAQYAVADLEDEIDTVMARIEELEQTNDGTR